MADVESAFVKALLLPAQYSSSIPDSDSSTSVSVSCVIDQVVTLRAGAAPYHFVSLPSRYAGIQFFGKLIGSSILPCYDVNFSRVMSDSYTYLRPSASMITLSSAVVSTTNAALAGIISAAAISDLRDLSNVSAGALVQTSMTSRDNIASLPLYKGVVLIAGPEIIKPMMPINAAPVTVAGGANGSGTTFALNSTTTLLVRFARLVTTGGQVVTLRAPDHSYNAYGVIEVNIEAPGAEVTCLVTPVYKRWDPVTGNEIITRTRPILLGTASSIHSTSGTLTYGPPDSSNYLFWGVEVDPLSGPAGTFVDLTISINDYDGHNSSHMNAHVAVIEGINADTPITVTGRVNYEAIPTAVLALDLKSDFQAKLALNSSEMHLAKIVFNSSTSSIKRVWSMEEYEALSTPQQVTSSMLHPLLASAAVAGSAGAADAITNLDQVGMTGGETAIVTPARIEEAKAQVHSAASMRMAFPFLSLLGAAAPLIGNMLGSLFGAKREAAGALGLRHSAGALGLRQSAGALSMTPTMSEAILENNLDSLGYVPTRSSAGAMRAAGGIIRRTATPFTRPRTASSALRMSSMRPNKYCAPVPSQLGAEDMMTDAEDDYDVVDKPATHIRADLKMQKAIKGWSQRRNSLAKRPTKEVDVAMFLPLPVAQANTAGDQQPAATETGPTSHLEKGEEMVKLRTPSGNLVLSMPDELSRTSAGKYSHRPTRRLAPQDEEPVGKARIEPTRLAAPLTHARATGATAIKVSDTVMAMDGAEWLDPYEAIAASRKPWAERLRRMANGAATRGAVNAALCATVVKDQGIVSGMTEYIIISDKPVRSLTNGAMTADTIYYKIEIESEEETLRIFVSDDFIEGYYTDDEDQRKQAEEGLKQLAYVAALTGLSDKYITGPTDGLMVGPSFGLALLFAALGISPPIAITGGVTRALAASLTASPTAPIELVPVGQIVIKHRAAAADGVPLVAAASPDDQVVKEYLNQAETQPLAIATCTNIILGEPITKTSLFLINTLSDAVLAMQAIAGRSMQQTEAQVEAGTKKSIEVARLNESLKAMDRNELTMRAFQVPIGTTSLAFQLFNIDAWQPFMNFVNAAGVSEERLRMLIDNGNVGKLTGIAQQAMGRAKMVPKTTEAKQKGGSMTLPSYGGTAVTTHPNFLMRGKPKATAGGANVQNLMAQVAALQRQLASTTQPAPRPAARRERPDIERETEAEITNLRRLLEEAQREKLRREQEEAAAMEVSQPAQGTSELQRMREQLAILTSQMAGAGQRLQQSVSTVNPFVGQKATPLARERSPVSREEAVGTRRSRKSGGGPISFNM